jgi:hypothetical protein
MADKFLREMHSAFCMAMRLLVLAGLATTRTVFYARGSWGGLPSPFLDVECVSKLGSSVSGWAT